ncbi:hypothetical protein J3U68_10265 [Snodgrassella sp. B3882]|uniref:hypothetical protein n=1 Tax=Snodgrassella sp. B3882 TaxID=2818037 RepID=UPI00226A6274|nr:hypothetical protein [Snodgrassella sp. B3882]MCX8745788.1 hypothetical protein [Snodgrassella sp. B3882]
MKKLIAIFFCMGLMTACNSESSKKDSASDATKIEASQTQVSTALAIPAEMVPASSSSAASSNTHAASSNTHAASSNTHAASSNTQSGTDMHSELRRNIQIMQQRLPIKMYGMDLTDLKFENNTIYYTYTITDKRVTSKNSSAEQIKNALYMACDLPDSKPFILDGNAIMYTYLFQDGSKVELKISAKDCR